MALMTIQVVNAMEMRTVPLSNGGHVHVPLILLQPVVLVFPFIVKTEIRMTVNLVEADCALWVMVRHPHYSKAVLMYLHSCSGANEGGRRTTGGHRSNACQLTSSDAIAAPPTTPRDVAHTEQPEPDRAHVLDVQTNCHPGPSFRRDDGDGGDGQGRAKGFETRSDVRLTQFQQVVLEYLRKCGIKHTVSNRGKTLNPSHINGHKTGHITDRKDWGDKYPPSIGLNHSEPSDECIFKFNSNLLACEGPILNSEMQEMG